MTGAAFLDRFVERMFKLNGPRSGWLPVSRRAALPHVVGQPTLSAAQLGAAAFAAEIEERESWIGQNCCRGDWDFSVRGHGRDYLFADPDDALWFKLRFG
jgi:hypothetical protein